jgi:AhpD family alkylhydroperoxidase
MGTQSMTNPVTIVPDVLRAIQAMSAAAQRGDVSARTLALVHLRTSQVTGGAACVDMGLRHCKAAGDTNERVLAVASWREAACFTDAERAALALAEAVTRASDGADPVPGEVWSEAARHYSEPGLLALLMTIALTPVFSRLRLATTLFAGARSRDDPR